MTLDDLRAAHPKLGFALYAYTPGEGVTLEVHDGGETFEFTGRSEDEACRRAFPAPVSCEPSGEASRLPADATPPSSVADGSHETSVFD